MASTLVSTLYPPLVDTFMPAFNRTGAMEITFALSPYNTPGKINRVHISLVDQNSNHSLFKTTYPLTQTGNKKTENNVLMVNDNTSELKILNNLLIIPFDDKQHIKYDSDTDLYTVILSPEEDAHLFQALDDVGIISEFNESGKPTGKKQKGFFQQYCRAQLRFDSSTAKIDSTNYLINERPYFSEWSSICLIKPIEEMHIQLNGRSFARAQTEDDFIPSFTQGMISISGRVESKEYKVPSNSKEDEIITLDGKKELKEKLSYFQVSLFNENEVLDDTGILYPDKSDLLCLDCMLNADNGIPGETYTLKVLAVTKNNFVMVKEQDISIADFEDEYVFNPEIKVEENSEDGYVSIHVKSINVGSEITKTAPGRIYLRRASSLDNFKNWEILSCKDVVSSIDVDTVFVDSTVASMVTYQYAVQFQFVKGTWSRTTRSETIFPTFYDMLLNRGDVQFAIRYNGQLSSLKPVVNRAKFDTLGSKYPKFAENAQLNYKQYSLSGLISAEGDFNRKFLTEVQDKYALDMEKYAEAFGETYMIRNDSLADGIQETGQTITSEIEDVNFHADPRACALRNTTHDVYPHENWFWERTFREEAIKWLNDGEPKLFKSMPEGNMIVMLTDISLTPNQGIGRMLYNFTATMYEVGDGYSLDALDAAGIIDTPEIFGEDLFNEDEEKEIGSTKVSSLRQLEIVGGSDAIGQLIEKIEKSYIGVFEDRKVKKGSLKIKNVKIEFTSLPQYMDTSLTEEGKLQLFGYAITEFCVCDKINDPNHEEPSLTTYSGLFVDSNGVYSFGNDMVLNKLIIKSGSTALLTAVVEYEEEIDTTTVPIETYKESTVVGQVGGLFEVGVPLGDKIREKYSIEHWSGKDAQYAKEFVDFTQQMKNWKSLCFDVTPYSVVDITFKEDKEPTRIMIGRSGVYRLEPNILVNDISFVGRQMFLNQVQGQYLDSWEYRIKEEKELEPSRNTVYIRDGKTVIWFNGEEYPFDMETEIAEIPIEGYINYLGDIVRSEFK